MGLVYIAKNTVNNNVYIGATKRDLKTRVYDHKKTYNNPESRLYDLKLYSAMRKYGFDNFEFEILEECEDSNLDELEKAYIQKYNSVKNGYNEALGGKGKPLWTDSQLEACKILYENNWLLKDIALLFNSNAKTVSKKLREKYNIDTRQNSYKTFRKRICGIDIEEEKVCFDSLSDAGRYLIENNYTNNKNLGSVLAKIEIALKNNCYTAYGFKWNYL